MSGVHIVWVIILALAGFSILQSPRNAWIGCFVFPVSFIAALTIYLTIGILVSSLAAFTWGMVTFAMVASLLWPTARKVLFRRFP